ncbi:nicotinamide N-methyltransferase-like protein [Cladochytrium replicatum]|nr:nicotinamide N-methyltransferase-like protein [Cladochytrium replicatum]
MAVCSVLLARYFCWRFPNPVNESFHAIELDSGTGLAGLALAHCLGSYGQFVLTYLDGAIPLIGRNVVENGLQEAVQAQELEWGVNGHAMRTPSALEAEGVNLVFAADVIYWPHLHDPLVSTLRQLTEGSLVDAEVIIAYKVREMTDEINFFWSWRNTLTLNQ